MIRAPEAPIAPAWFTVAMPAMIEPSTSMISASGGTRISTTRPAKRRSRLPWKGTGGAALGLKKAKTRIYSM